ncbi:MAG: CDP-alcohol phosphatidyltransferase family protein, partial [Clostridia bacterium]|nr:CDP-alcohol phosphatidyltransferase family protein [Clostridia bacterium]
MNLPTKITVSRILLIPVFLVLFYVPFWGNYFFAALVFSLCACTDFVDGYIARKRNQIT